MTSVYLQSGRALIKDNAIGLAESCCCSGGCCGDGWFLPNRLARSRVVQTYEVTQALTFPACWPYTPRTVGSSFTVTGELWTQENSANPGPQNCFSAMWNRDSREGFYKSGGINLYKPNNTGVCTIISSHYGNFGQVCFVGSSSFGSGFSTSWDFDPDQTSYQRTRYWFQYTYQNGGLVYIITATPTPIPDPPPVQNTYFPPRVWSYSGVRVKTEAELVFE